MFTNSICLVVVDSWQRPSEWVLIEFTAALGLKIIMMSMWRKHNEIMQFDLKTGNIVDKCCGIVFEMSWDDNGTYSIVCHGASEGIEYKPYKM